MRTASLAIVYNYRMLNLFPSLLVFSFFAPLLLRVVLGLWLLTTGYKHFLERRTISAELSRDWGTLGKAKGLVFGLFEILLSGLLITGFITQIAVLMVAVMALGLLVFRKKYASLKPESPWLYVFVLTISLSLLLTGAGALAFDLPL